MVSVWQIQYKTSSGASINCTEAYGDDMTEEKLVEHLELLQDAVEVQVKQVA